jgi:hypothetical protein
LYIFDRGQPKSRFHRANSFEIAVHKFAGYAPGYYLPHPAIMHPDTSY